MFAQAFAKLKNYVNADAQKIIQNLIEGGKSSVETTPYNLESIKKAITDYGIPTMEKLKCQVSGRVYEIVSILIAEEWNTYHQFNGLLPNDTAGMRRVACDSFHNKTQILNIFEGCTC